MIVYRCVSERELADMMGIKNRILGPRGVNSFKYKGDIDYRHFFYHYDAAVSFMNILNIDRYYNKYSNIVAFDINDDILSENIGVGQYNLDCVSSEVKDNILKYFKRIYFPEFAIPIDSITNNMIVGIGNQTRITPVSYMTYYDLEDTIRDSQLNFLEYQKWLFKNGTNVPMKTVLENFNNLFPIGDEQKIKIKNKSQY